MDQLDRFGSNGNPEESADFTIWLRENVGACGFEPQTPTVSKQRSTCRKSNNTAVSLVFSALPDQLPDQPGEFKAGSGYDLVTGIGVPNIRELIRALTQ
jgi:hypothetical protein